MVLKKNKNQDNMIINSSFFQLKIVFLLLLPFISLAQMKIPEEYSEVTQSPSNGNKMEKIVMSFDNDTITDTIVLVEDISEFSKYKLLLFLTSQNKTFEIDLISLNEFSIYPVQIKARKNVIEFGYYEDGTANFGRFIKLRYNTTKNQIQVIGYDIEYKSSPTQYVKKSYNLITGNYIVKKNHYNENGKVNVQEFSGKNNSFKNNVFVENFDKEMILNLDDVGSKYE
jgi:hypothetical protein